MINYQKTLNPILCLVIGFSLLFPYEVKCSEKGHPPKKYFAPRYLINIGVDMFLTVGFYRSNEKWSNTEFAAMLFANSATGVIIFQNHHSVIPFLKTSLLTGAAFAGFELVGNRSDGYELPIRMLSWFFVMPFIASKTNHIIYLKRYKKRQIELNLLKPTYLSYDRKMLPGIQLIQLNW